MDPLDDASIELGPIYRSAAVVDPPPAAEEPALEDPREPTGRPGIRAPHLPLEQDGASISTHDLVRGGFVLLTGSDGQAWCEAAASVAESLNVPLTAHSVAATGPLADKKDRFAGAYGIGSRGAVLVRPDRIIGWRAADLTDDPRAAIEDAMARLLSR